MMKSRLVLAALLGSCAFSASALAAITGPYTVDANTLHLYHLNESGLPAVDSAGTLNMQGPTGNTSTSTTPNSQGFLAPTFGAGTYSGFGTAADFSAQALSNVGTAGSGSAGLNPLQNPPHRPILIAGTALSSNDSTDLVTSTFSSAPAVGGPGGAFTMEAIVKFDGSFNPTSTTYRNTAVTTTNAGTVAGNYFMDIMMGDSDGVNANRLFQFRIQQASASTALRVEFAPLYGISGNQSLLANIPTTGVNAANNTDSFQIAVTYNGVENTAGNFSFYWTKLDPANTVANLIGTAQMNKDLTTGANGTTEFSIGNEARDNGTGAGEGESFVGTIDEVRISSVARAPTDFIFAVPEPTSLTAVAGMTLGLLRRRRNV